MEGKMTNKFSESGTYLSEYREGSYHSKSVTSEYKGTFITVQYQKHEGKWKVTGAYVGHNQFATMHAAKRFIDNKKQKYPKQKTKPRTRKPKPMYPKKKLTGGYHRRGGAYALRPIGRRSKK